MKIGDIRASLHRHEIDLPGIGKSIESRMFVFVEVETDEGLKGFGITGSILPWAVIACIEHHLAPALKGRDVLHTEAIHSHVWRTLDSRTYTGVISNALSAIDIALWDIRGKKENRPIYELVGGYRNWAPTYASAARRHVDRQLSEMFLSLSQHAAGRPAPYRFRSLLPNLRDLVECRWVLLWSLLTSFFVGVVPGVGATASTMVAYAAAKKYARHPEEFGKGAIRGVAAPEAANNSASYAAMIPLFALGIPASGTTAVLLGGLLMVGLQPGPLLFATNPDFVWTVFGPFWIGNLMLVALTVVMIPVLASVVFVPTAILYPAIIGIVMFGVYSINYAMSDVTIALIAGAAGFIMMKLDYSPVPLVLGLVLGPLLERGVRRTLIVSDGDLMIFLQSPIALAFFLLTAATIAAPIVRRPQRISV